MQAIGILLEHGQARLCSPRIFFNYITIILCLTAGTALIMWLGERINEKGIGNGISLLIFIGIVSRRSLSEIITLLHQRVQREHQRVDPGGL